MRSRFLAPSDGEKIKVRGPGRLAACAVFTFTLTIEFMAKDKIIVEPISRRNFLALSGAVPAAILTQSLRDGAFAAPAPAAAAPTAAKKYPIGLELYSVRTELMRDLPNTLKTVAKIGYEVVEFYAPYFNWPLPYAKDVRTQLDDLGLRCYSTHNHIESLTPGDTMAKAIELNQILGARHIVLASAPGSTKGLEGWKRLCEQLTAAVGQLKPHGLSAGFHNHQAEWAAVDGGQRIMDVIAANTPKEFVLQFDVGTCMEAGMDPIAWIQANPGRIKSVHLKDWAPGDRAQEKGYRVLFGEGVTPWKELIAAVESIGGVEFYLMEQEGSRFSEFETAQHCLDTWKKMRGKD
jgi:sugar phosphate isomerase/epimerase